MRRKIALCYIRETFIIPYFESFYEVSTMKFDMKIEDFVALSILQRNIALILNYWGLFDSVTAIFR